MDRYQRNLSQFRDVTASGQVAATDDLSSTARTLAAARTGETIYIQKVTINVLTDNAATQTVQDSSNTPVVAVKTKASPGLGAITVDFGGDGYALTEGKALTLANSAAGLAYSYVVQAYQRRTATWVGNSASVPAGYGTGS